MLRSDRKHRLLKSTATRVSSQRFEQRKLLIESLEQRCLMAADFSNGGLQNIKLHASQDLTPTHFYAVDGVQQGMVISANRIAIDPNESSIHGGCNLSSLGLTLVRTINDKFNEYESPSQLDSSFGQSLVGIGIASSVAPVFVMTKTHSEAVLLNEVIVALAQGVSSSDYFAQHKQFSSFRPLLGTSDEFIATVTAGNGEAALKVANESADDKSVAWVSPNFYQNWQKYYVPNDPRFTNQWHLNNTGQGGGLVDADSDLPEAWDVVSTATSAFTIGVVDDGVETHPDLNLWTNPGEIAGNGVDDDGNGWIDDVNGWNFVSNNNLSGDTNTTDKHGTSVSGVAAANGDNGLGVTGAAYKAKVLSAKIFEGAAVANDAGIASALYYAAGRKASGTGTWKSADIVNNSWGGGGQSVAINAALSWGTTAGRQGVGATYFFATGNDFGSVSEPAVQSLNIPGVVAVGATNNKGTIADYSNTGDAVDIVTPSNDTRSGYLAIDTTDRTGSNGYASGDYTGTGSTGFGGTSSATPLATGIATLVLARASVLGISLSPTQLRGLLRNNTDLIGSATYDIATGKHHDFGFGRLNAAAAVRAVGNAEISVVNSTSEILTGGTVSVGNVSTGDSLDVTYRIRNQGTSTLNISSIIASPSTFVILSGPTDSALSLGETATFVVRISPTSGGAFSGNITINSNDVDEGAFGFSITGTAINPSISGIAFEDWNGDGIRSTIDPGMKARVAFLDANNNGTFDSNIGTTTYTNNTPVTLLDPGTVTSTKLVSGFTGSITDINVRLSLTHTWDSDLNVTLISPSGKRVLLFSGVGSGGQNFTNTILDDEASTPIASGTAPFTGSFIPAESLSALDGGTANGTWTLEVTDTFAGDTGVLQNWDLVVARGEQFASSNSTGYYFFPGLANGTYNVRPILPSGWVATGATLQAVTIASPTDSFQGRDFGSEANNRFYGYVFNDLDGDGVVDAGENGLAGRTLYLDSNNNGVFEKPWVVGQQNTTLLPIPDLTTQTSTVTVPSQSAPIADVNVKLNISMSWDDDLDVFLIHPDGTRVELFTDVGGSGDNFTNTTIDDQAGTAITAGTAPFTGSFRPEGNLAALNGKSAAGIWTLEVSDDTSGDQATLLNWELDLVGQGESSITTISNGTGSFDLANGAANVRLLPAFNWLYTIPADGLQSVTASGAPLPDKRFGAKPNTPPSVGATNPSVNGNEGQTISNTGTWSDPDIGSSVTLTASVGTIVKNANGTWNWSLISTDDVAPTNVTITADDGIGGVTTTSFSYSVINVAPALTATQATVSGNVLTALTNSGTWSDVPADTVSLSASLGTVTKNANGTWSWTYTPSTAMNNQTVTITGSDEDGGSSTVNFAITALVNVTNRSVYYKGSSFSSNGNNVSAALDTSKVLAVSGASPITLGNANLINTTRGINGLVFDVAGLGASVTAADLRFRMSPTGLFNEAANPPSSWTNAPAPSAFVPTSGNSTTPARLRVEWADNAIANRWLQIRILANANTGLLNPITYYIGHLQGEVNGQIVGGSFFVTTQDQTAVLPLGVAAVTSPRDLDKNGFVTTQDITAARLSIQALRSLKVITIPAAGSGGEGEGDESIAAPVQQARELELRSMTSDSTPTNPVMPRITNYNYSVELPSNPVLANSSSASNSLTNSTTKNTSIGDLLSLDEYFVRLGKKK